MRFFPVALKEHLRELIEIEMDERAKLIDMVPDIVADTPRTPTAIVRFGSLLGRLSSSFKGALVDLLKEVASEVVIKKLDL